MRVIIHHPDKELALDVPDAVADQIVDAWRERRQGTGDAPGTGSGGELLLDADFLAEAPAVSMDPVGGEHELVLLAVMRVRGPDLDMPDAQDEVAGTVCRFWSTVGDATVEVAPVSATVMDVLCRTVIAGPVAWPRLCWIVTQARQAAEGDGFSVGCIIESHDVQVDAT